MWHLYLDESGDLGFDFENKKPSKYFTVTILVVKSVKDNRALRNAVRKTIARKLNSRSKRRRPVHELKGYGTTIEIKRYFYQKVAQIPFDIFCVTLNKQQFSSGLTKEKHRIYNYVSRQVLDVIPLGEAETRIKLVIDKNKNIPQIQEFNSSVTNQLAGRLDPQIPMDIHHRSSAEEFGLQAADIFSWGIFRGYEYGDSQWYDIFRSKVRYDHQYPKK